MKSVHCLFIGAAIVLLAAIPVQSQDKSGSSLPDDKRRQALPVMNLGNHMLLTGNLKMAVQKFEQAIEIDPSFDKAYHNLGDAYLKLNDYEKALQAHQKAIELNPSSLNYLSLGKTYVKKQNLAEAEKAFRKSVQLEPSSSPANLELGDFLRKKGNFDEAKPFLLKAQANLGSIKSDGVERALQMCEQRDKSE